MRRRAMDLLARREHSCRELIGKLERKGWPAEVAREVTAELEAEGMLSDDRFTESLVEVRRNRGQGPLRIQRDLMEKGVAPEIIERWLDQNSLDWIENLRRVRQKKYGNSLPSNYKERARQARFLQSRGFSTEQIRQVLNTRETD